MKNAIITFILFVFTITLINAQDNTKEVFIIGTMHSVSKFLKNSYKPLYKKASEYSPDAIYVETQRAEDSLSVALYRPWFLEYSDSMALAFPMDDERFLRLSVTDLQAMDVEDFRFMAKSYAAKRDYANYSYFYYLFKYGVGGPDKPSRNENGDISHKLATQLNMKYIFSMDDQTEYREYHKAWQECARMGAENGDNKKLKKLLRRDFLCSMFPSLFGRLGHFVNRGKAGERMHIINSFQYAGEDCQPCRDGEKYWDNRNARMVANIVEQVRENEHRKNLVVVGAGHVYGMVREFKEKYPDIKVKLIDGDVPETTTNPAAVAKN